MGCCGSKDGGSAKRAKLSDIPEKPEIEGVASVTEVCGALWGIKEKWGGIRNPMSAAVKGLQDAAEWEGGDLAGIAKGLIAAICSDSKLQPADLKGIISVTTESPFLKFDAEKSAIVKKYMGVIEALQGCVTEYTKAVEGIQPLIDEITAFPEKITAAVDKAKEDIGGLADMGAKMKAGAAVAGAAKDCKKCCQILLGDLNGVKDDLMEFKKCGEGVQKLCADVEMIKGIGEAVRTAKAENIKDSAAVIKKEEEKKAKK